MTLSSSRLWGWSLLLVLVICSWMFGDMRTSKMELGDLVGGAEWLKWSAQIGSEKYEIVESKSLERKVGSDVERATQRFSFRGQKRNSSPEMYEMNLQVTRYGHEAAADSRYWEIRNEALGFYPHNPELKASRGWEHLIVQPGELMFWGKKGEYLVMFECVSEVKEGLDGLHVVSIAVADEVLRGLEGHGFTRGRKVLKDLGPGYIGLELGYRSRDGNWADYVAKGGANVQEPERLHGKVKFNNPLAKAQPREGFNSDRMLERIVPHSFVEIDGRLVGLLGVIGILFLLLAIWVKKRRQKAEAGSALM